MDTRKKGHEEKKEISEKQENFLLRKLRRNNNINIQDKKFLRQFWHQIAADKVKIFILTTMEEIHSGFKNKLRKKTIESFSGKCSLEFDVCLKPTDSNFLEASQRKKVE